MDRGDPIARIRLSLLDVTKGTSVAITVAIGGIGL